MVRSKLIPATAVAIIALSGVAAALAASGKTEDDKEISAMLGAKTTLPQAISAAEQETGGRAMKVNIEHEKGAYLYEIKAVSKDRATEVFVDPTTGKIARQEKQGLIAKVLDKKEQDEFAKMAASSSLSSAIATAEKETGGKAVEAAFESEDGATVFEVETAKDKTVQRVKIDATTGEVLTVSAAEKSE